MATETQPELRRQLGENHEIYDALVEVDQKLLLNSGFVDASSDPEFLRTTTNDRLRSICEDRYAPPLLRTSIRTAVLAFDGPDHQGHVDVELWQNSRIVLKTNSTAIGIDAYPLLDRGVEYLRENSQRVDSGVPRQFLYSLAGGTQVILDGKLTNVVMTDMQSALRSNRTIPIKGMYEKGRWLQLMWSLSSKLRVSNRQSSTPQEALKTERENGRMMTVAFSKILRRTGIRLYRFEGDLPDILQRCLNEFEKVTMAKLKAPHRRLDGVSVLQRLQEFAADTLAEPINASSMELDEADILSCMPQHTHDWKEKLKLSKKDFEADVWDDIESSDDASGNGMAVDGDEIDEFDEFDDFGDESQPIVEGAPLKFIDGSESPDEHGAKPDFGISSLPEEKERLEDEKKKTKKKKHVIVKLEMLGEAGNWVEHLWRTLGYGWETLKSFRNKAGFSVNVVVRGESRYVVVLQFIRYGESVVWKTRPIKLVSARGHFRFADFLLSLLMQERRCLGLFPEKIGKYVLQGCLGSGGEACVFLVRESLNGTHYPRPTAKAMKIFRSQDAFEAERRSHAKFAELGIVSSHLLPTEFATLDGMHVATMPICVGSVFESGRQQWLDLAAWLSDIHARGIVHMDISPGNVLSRAEGLCLVDWSFALQPGDEIPENFLTTTSIFPSHVAVTHSDVWIDQIMFLRTAYLMASPNDISKFLSGKVEFPGQYVFQNNMTREQFLEAVAQTVAELGDSSFEFLPAGPPCLDSQPPEIAEVTLEEWQKVVREHHQR